MVTAMTIHIQRVLTTVSFRTLPVQPEPINTHNKCDDDQ